ncbi:MAG: hypothetical protein ACKOPG_10470 [Novosphingobium sp.]
MTAAVIAFPTLVERDDSEFRRKGTSSYIRAIDEAEALWSAVHNHQAGAALSSRIDALSRQIERLADLRSEVAEDLIAFGSAAVELRLVPELLRATAKHASRSF